MKETTILDCVHAGFKYSPEDWDFDFEDIKFYKSFEDGTWVFLDNDPELRGQRVFKEQESDNFIKAHFDWNMQRLKEQ